jgi:phosphate transport system permease protein
VSAAAPGTSSREENRVTFGAVPGLARRRAKNRAMTLVLAALMAATIAVLAWVLFYVAAQGLKYLGPKFLTNTPPGDPSQPGGGFVNGIIGSVIMVGLATCMAVPIAIAAAVVIAEYGGRFARVTSFLTDVLMGVPSIVSGLFIYAIWVLRFGFSGFAGSLALAIVMLPLVIRATAVMIGLVPVSLREASYALGVTRARTITSVVLPTALPGIITGVMLAVARAMGETAPLLVTTLGNDLFVQANPTKRMSALPLQIFGNAITGFKAAQARAWAGALTLIGIVLIFTVIARLIGQRTTVGN